MRPAGLWRDIPVTADTLRAMGTGELEAYLKELSPKQLEELSNTYEFWARPSQLEPVGNNWDYWLFNAGRGAGKTFAGSNFVRHRVKAGDKRIACVAPTKGDVRRVMVEGDSGLLNMCWKGDKDYKGKPIGYPEWSPTNNTMTWENGATATFFSAEDPDRLRGPQFHSAWCFIAGTQVTTPYGNKKVQYLEIGETVLTSRGFQPIVGKCSRVMPVGTVTFSNGVSLTGTSEHPIWTQRGWVNLGQLKESDTVCAIDVLSGVVSGGIPITTTTMNTEELGQRVVKTALTSTERFMRKLMDLSQRVSTLTTSTVTSSIMNLLTLKQCLDQTTCASTGQSIRLSQQTTKLSGTQDSAMTVAKMLLEVSRQNQPYAQDVHRREQTKIELQKGLVPTVKESLCQYEVGSVVSVVSTWVEETEQTVYNIEVKNQSEYFANGILTHNCDEVSSWRNQQDVWDMLSFCMRLGKHPRIMVTTTPKPTKLMRKLLSHPRSHVTGGSTFDNAANLAPTFLEAVTATYEGTRLGRQELYAEMLEEAEGALWNTDTLDACLDESITDTVEFAKTLKRVVISIDPAITSNEESDLTGIMVAGVDINGRGFILEDHTDRYTPQQWAAKAISLYHKFSADRIVAERNQGGEMVRSTLTSEDETVPIRLVHASRGKFARAEPVSALYEQGKVSHAKGLDELETQMRTWEPLGSIGSPDRLDAMVWAITDLMLKGTARPTLRLAYSDAKGLVNGR